MLRPTSAKECPATESALAAIDEPWCGTQQPRTNGDPSNARALAAPSRAHDQHKQLDTAPLLQECRSATRARYAIPPRTRAQIVTAERALDAPYRHLGVPSIRRSGSPNHRSGAGKLHPSSEDRRHGAVASETVAFLDTPLADMGTAAAEAWGIHNWSPQR
jgi:hypothetical protein